MIDVNAMFESSVRLFGNWFHPGAKLPRLGSIELCRMLRQMSAHLGDLQRCALNAYRDKHMSVHTDRVSSLSTGMTFWWDGHPLTIVGVANDVIDGVVYRVADMDGKVLESISFRGDEIVNLHKV